MDAMFRLAGTDSDREVDVVADRVHTSKSAPTTGSVVPMRAWAPMFGRRSGDSKAKGQIRSILPESPNTWSN